MCDSSSTYVSRLQQAIIKIMLLYILLNKSLARIVKEKMFELIVKRYKIYAEIMDRICVACKESNQSSFV